MMTAANAANAANAERDTLLTLSPVTPVLSPVVTSKTSDIVAQKAFRKAYVKRLFTLEAGTPTEAATPVVPAEEAESYSAQDAEVLKLFKAHMRGESGKFSYTIGQLESVIERLTESRKASPEHPSKKSKKSPKPPTNQAKVTKAVAEMQAAVDAYPAALKKYLASRSPVARTASVVAQPSNESAAVDAANDSVASVEQASNGPAAIVLAIEDSALPEQLRNTDDVGVEPTNDAENHSVSPVARTASVVAQTSNGSDAVDAANDSVAPVAQTSNGSAAVDLAIENSELPEQLRNTDDVGVEPAVDAADRSVSPVERTAAASVVVQASNGSDAVDAANDSVAPVAQASSEPAAVVDVRLAASQIVTTVDAANDSAAPVLHLSNTDDVEPADGAEPVVADTILAAAGQSDGVLGAITVEQQDLMNSGDGAELRPQQSTVSLEHPGLTPAAAPLIVLDNITVSQDDTALADLGESGASQPPVKTSKWGAKSKLAGVGAILSGLGVVASVLAVQFAGVASMNAIALVIANAGILAVNAIAGIGTVTALTLPAMGTIATIVTFAGAAAALIIGLPLTYAVLSGVGKLLSWAARRVCAACPPKSSPDATAAPKGAAEPVPPTAATELHGGSDARAARTDGGSELAGQERSTPVAGGSRGSA